MTKLADIFDIDDSKLKSDWDNIYDMLDDIKAYVKKTNGIVFNADDPGYHHEHQRSPRIGFASSTNDKEWTIELAKVSKQIKNVPEKWSNLRKLLTSSNGRQNLIKYLNGEIENSVE